MSEEKTRILPMKELDLSTLLKKLILLLVVFKDLATISRTKFNGSEILIVFIT